MRTPVNQINNPGPRDRIRWLAAVVYGWDDLAVENNQMPRFGIGQVVTAITRGGQSVFGVTRPRSGKYTVSTSDYKVTYDATTGLTLDLTAPTAFVAAGNIGFTEGQGGTVTQDWPALVFCDESNTAGGSVVIGSTVGPIAGSWYVGKNGSGFRVVGIDTSLTAPTGYKAVWISPHAESASPFCEFHQFIGRDFETYNAGGTDYDRWFNHLTATLGDVRDQYTNGTDAYGAEGGGTLFVKYVTGSPESAGIEYHGSELDPHANGNFEILQDGLYRIRFNCYAHANLSTMTYADRETDTFSSSSPVHSHMVEVWEPVSPPRLSIQMWRKPSGGSIALYADNQSNNPINFGYIFPVMRKQIGDSASNPAYQISLEEDVNLNAGDRIGFRAYGYHLGYNAGDDIVKNDTTIRLSYGSLAFTYLGSQRLLENA